MPGILYHILFAEKVFEKLKKPLMDKKDFLSGNLIPDLALNKKASHYRKEASLKGFTVPDLEKAGKELLKKNNDVLVGIYCHLYLDYYFIEDFLISYFDWDYKKMEVNSLRKNLKWPVDTFFAKPSEGGILYKGYSEINKLLIRKGDISTETLDMIPEILPNSGIECFDARREKTWKEELNEYLSENVVYTGDIINYYDLTLFITKLAEKFVSELHKHVIDNASTFAIITTRALTIDSASSALAMFWYLISKGKNKEDIHILIPRFPEEFNFLPGSEYIKSDLTTDYLGLKPSYDILIAVDCPCINMSLLPFSIEFIYDIWINNLVKDEVEFSFENQNATSCTTIIYDNFKCVDKNFLECVAYGLASNSIYLNKDYTKEDKSLIAYLKNKRIRIRNLQNKIYKALDRSEKIAKVAIERGTFKTKGSNKIFCTYLLQSDLEGYEKKLKELNHKNIIDVIEKNVEYTTLILLIENNKKLFKGSLRTKSTKLNLIKVCKTISEKRGSLTFGGRANTAGFYDYTGKSQNEIFKEFIAYF